MKTNHRISYGEDHTRNLKTVIALNRATNLLNRRASAVFWRHGLTMTQFAVLEVLYHKGDLAIGEIIRTILSTGGNMTVVLKNLTKEKLVTKRADPADSRVGIISITALGRRKMEALFPEYLEDLHDFLKSMPDEEKNTLTVLLKRMQRKGANDNTPDQKNN